MLRSHVRIAYALKHLRTDAKGIVSLEYVVTAACIIAAVGAAFNTGASGPIKTTLIDALTTIGAALAAAVGS